MMAKTLITIKLAGDSGDGIQLTGHRLAMIHALFGSEVATHADYPAEIRAPRGTTYGVSAYQIQIGCTRVFTPGDKLDVLLALSPAALSVTMGQVKDGALIIVDKDSFTDDALQKLGLPTDDNHPLLALNRQGYQLIDLPISQLLMSLFSQDKHKKKDILQSKNFFCLGVLCWLFERDTSSTEL
ncbi:MAG: 2-oxoacid:acceptor oxidoreductase family protein, partial [Proteobacteria bacterium]|nr:2-oxoacid:acceptor oxidoreductase family protein [Pseudomonadota bacterium]